MASSPEPIRSGKARQASSNDNDIQLHDNDV